MAQFKKGEYVTSKERPELGKGKIIDEVDFNQYIVKFGSGAQDLFEWSDLVAANACAKNGIRSTNAAVNAALNGCGTAKNVRAKVGRNICDALGLMDAIKTKLDLAIMDCNDDGVRNGIKTAQGKLNALSKDVYSLLLKADGQSL